MTAGGDPGVLLRRLLAERLGEENLGWLDESAPLADQGVGSLDLIAALARLQRDAGLGIPGELRIDEGTTLASVAAALRPTGTATRPGV